MCTDVYKRQLSLFMGVTDISSISFSSFNIGAIKDVFLAMSLKNVLTIPFIVAVFSITIVIVFENMGILYGQMEVKLLKTSTTVL